MLNAFILETPDQASRAMARAVDAKIAKGEGGPLAGIPLGIKDLFATKDVRTTRVLKDPRQFRAALRIHHNLRNSGATAP